MVELALEVVDVVDLTPSMSCAWIVARVR